MSGQSAKIDRKTCRWCGVSGNLTAPNGQCTVCGVHRSLPVWDRASADERVDALYRLFAAGRFREVAEAAVDGQFAGLGRALEQLVSRAIQHVLNESVGALQVYYLPIEVKGKERHGFGWVWPETYCVTEMRLYLTRDAKARTSTIVRGSRDVRAENRILESGIESRETILEVACKGNHRIPGVATPIRSFKRRIRFGEGEGLQR